MKIIWILLSTATLFSCAGQESKREADGSTFEPPKVVLDHLDNKPDESEKRITSDKAGISIDRKLIKNGSIHFRVKEVKRTKEEVEKICKELGAYISNESQTNYGNGLSYNQKIRIPAQRFEELIQKVESLADHLDNKNIGSQDVTEEFIDVESRLKAKRELEKRYLELLQRGKSVEELLSIERELGNVRAEIESMEGRLNYLKNQVAFSTLDLTYYEERRTDFGFSFRFSKSLAEGWDNLLTFFIGLISIWPFVILIGAGTWASARYWKRRKSHKQ